MTEFVVSRGAVGVPSATRSDSARRAAAEFILTNYALTSALSMKHHRLVQGKRWGLVRRWKAKEGLCTVHT